MGTSGNRVGTRSRARVRALPHRWLHLRGLHHPGLLGGGLLLHLPEAQGAVPAAHPLLAAQLSDGGPAHDPALRWPACAVPPVQHGHQLQLHRGLHSQVLLRPSGARLPGALPAPTLHHRPPHPPGAAVGVPGVAPVLCLPAPAGAPAAREELPGLQSQLTGCSHRACGWWDCRGQVQGEPPPRGPPGTVSRDLATARTSVRGERSTLVASSFPGPGAEWGVRRPRLSPPELVVMAFQAVLLSCDTCSRWTAKVQTG